MANLYDQDATYGGRVKERRVTLNDTDREQWIDNDEGLYDWWRSSRMSKRKFIREHRAELDAAILPVLNNEKPAHHLKYGGENHLQYANGVPKR